MPLTTTFAGASARSFGWLGGGVGKYWIGLLENAGGSDRFSGVATDNQNNVYCAGQATISSVNGLALAKYAANGSLNFQKRLTGDGISARDIVATSTNNLYVTGDGSGNINIIKYNSAGSVQWQRKLTTGSAQGIVIAVDSSENVFVGGANAPSGEYENILAKYNSSGTLQWQRNLGSVGTLEQPNGIAVDSAGDIYLTGAAGNDAFIAKYNTSGVLQWQRKLGSANADSGRGIVADSSNNIYVSGYYEITAGGNLGQYIAKYNSSGAIQWQRVMTGTGVSVVSYALAVDSFSNIYSAGSRSGQAFLAKYNSSGTLQWQRTLDTSGTDTFYKIKVDSNNDLLCVGETNISGTYDMLVAKFPSDGSKTGTYAIGPYSFTYATATLTEAAGSLTDASGTLTAGTSTLTDSATTYTESDTTLTALIGAL